MESIKTARVSIEAVPDTLSYAEIPIFPGRDEVALLLGTSWTMYISAACYLYAGIWRKSSPRVEATLLTTGYQSADLVDHTVAGWVQSTAVGIWLASQVQDKRFPEPLILLRPPQLVAYGSVADVGFVYVTCYYRLKTVSKTELAKLMAKDHA